MSKLKIRQEFKDDMNILFIVSAILIFIGCIYYSWCMFLIDTIGLPCLGQKHIFEIIVSGTLYSCLFFIIIGTILIVYNAVISISKYIFE